MASSSPSKYLSSQHRIDGILYPLFVGKNHLENLKTFKQKPNDVFVVSYPKSGTHWMLKIVYLIIHNGEDEYIHSTPSRDDMVWIEDSEKPDYNKIPLEDMPDPRLFGSHSYYSTTAGGPPHTSPAKYIYCSRNPKDVFVAFYHHHIRRNQGNDKIDFDLSWDEFFERFLRGDVSFGSWWDHVPEWWAHRHEPNVLFLIYEDLKKDLATHVAKIAEFLGHKLDEDTIQKIAQATTIESMKKNTCVWNNEQFLRKGIVGDWKNHFTPTQSAQIDALCEKIWQDHGLKYDFE